MPVLLERYCFCVNCVDQLVDSGRVQISGHSQCSAECSAPLCQAQTTRIQVQPCTSTGESSRYVGDQRGTLRPLLTNHDPQQIGSRPLFPAPHARSDRRTGFHARRIRGLTSNHCPLYRRTVSITAFHRYPLDVAGRSDASPTGAASLRMSIRQPVNRAARRAF